MCHQLNTHTDGSPSLLGKNPMSGRRGSSINLSLGDFEGEECLWPGVRHEGGIQAINILGAETEGLKEGLSTVLEEGLPLHSIRHPTVVREAACW